MGEITSTGCALFTTLARLRLVTARTNDALALIVIAVDRVWADSYRASWACTKFTQGYAAKIPRHCCLIDMCFAQVVLFVAIMRDA